MEYLDEDSEELVEEVRRDKVLDFHHQNTLSSVSSFFCVPYLYLSHDSSFSSCLSSSSSLCVCDDDVTLEILDCAQEPWETLSSQECCQNQT